MGIPAWTQPSGYRLNRIIEKEKMIMGITLARIDNRLLHGIVATQWAPISNCTRLMVIDDKVAADLVLKESMKLARPVGVALSIISEETALANLSAKKYEGQKIFVVTKNPSTLLKVLQTGERIPKIIIGGTVSIEGGTVLSSRAMASQEDLEAYKAIASYKVPVRIQYVPADKEIPLECVVEI